VAASRTSFEVDLRFAATPRSVPPNGFRERGPGNYRAGKRTKGDAMYIGGGALALIIVILLLVWLL
jgi:hypothetical protein